MSRGIGFWVFIVLIFIFGFSLGGFAHAYATDNLESNLTDCIRHHEKYSSCDIALQSCEGELARYKYRDKAN